MDVTPATDLPKRTNPKRKAEAAPKAPAKKAAGTSKTKKPKSVRVGIKESAVVQETTPAAQKPLANVHAQIAVAAYYLAERRHFASGHEIDDWLQAERQVLGAL
jgi:hypothetical protein